MTDRTWSGVQKSVRPKRLLSAKEKTDNHAAREKEFFTMKAAHALYKFVKNEFRTTVCVCKFTGLMGTNVACTHCEAEKLLETCKPKTNHAPARKE